VGEVYLSQSLTVISDNTVIPPRLITSAVALFMLVVTIIGGSSPLLIPVVQEFIHEEDVTIDFQAMSMYNTTLSKKHILFSIFTASHNPVFTAPTTVQFAVQNKNADILQNSILYSLIGCYALSGILYLLAFLYMKSYST
jgi:hypothetical protein